MAVDIDLIRGGFVKTGEITPQHDEIRAHRKRQRNVVVLDDAAVRANRYINAGFLKIFIACRRDFNQCGCLSAADALLFAGDADRAAADADFDKIRARFCQETEAVTVHDIARADLDLVAIVRANPIDGAALPFGEALGGVDAECVRPRLNQRRDTLGIVAGVDARADDITFVLVEQLQGIFLVGIVVLAEYHIDKMLVFIDQREGIQLVVPDDVVCFFQRGISRCGNQLFKGRHEIAYHLGPGHARNAVVTAGDNAQQPAVCRAVVGDGYGRMSGAFFQREDIIQRGVRLDIGIGNNKARFPHSVNRK